MALLDTLPDASSRKWRHIEQRIALGEQLPYPPDRIMDPNTIKHLLDGARMSRLVHLTSSRDLSGERAENQGEISVILKLLATRHPFDDRPTASEDCWRVNIEHLISEGD